MRAVPAPMSLSPAPALIIAHPGHEVRVHGWLSACRPVTYVMTDGSGATGVGRMAPTDAILREAGAERREAFAPLSDSAAYEAIRTTNLTLFREITESIARDLTERETRSVMGDAYEGYNPVHDVCRLMIDAAVTIASRHHAIEQWSFTLVGPPAADVENGLRFTLDDDAFERKMRVAERYRELAPDVMTAVRDFGRDAFRNEVFTPVAEPAWCDRRFLDETPYYETHGEERVSEGKYAEVIRYCRHILPIAEALRELAACAS